VRENWLERRKAQAEACVTGVFEAILVSLRDATIFRAGGFAAWTPLENRVLLAVASRRTTKNDGPSYGSRSGGGQQY